MPTNRLYRAIKEKQNAQSVYDAACFTGNYTPARSLPHSNPLVFRLREANVELNNAMEEARAIIEAPSESARRVAARIAGERDIARYLLQSLSEQGFKIGGYDGEEELEYTTDWKNVFASMFDTDEFWVQVRANKNEAGWDDSGWIRLIYGNSPEEMISDYTTNLEQYLKPTFKYIKSFYDPSYIIEGE